MDRQRFGDLSAMALDPIATCHLVRLLRGDFDCFDRLILSHDRGSDAKLFFVLRELRRLGELPDRPSVALVDIRHLPHRTTAEYNRMRIGELTAQFEEWAGLPDQPVRPRGGDGALQRQLSSTEELPGAALWRATSVFRR